MNPVYFVAVSSISFLILCFMCSGKNTFNLLIKFLFFSLGVWGLVQWLILARYIIKV